MRNSLNSHSGMAAATMSVRTVMSALRPCWSRSAISPKWSPGPSKRCRPSTVLTSAWPSRMTMNPTPSLPRRTGLAPLGWRTSRICLPSFFRSPSDISANRPTGFRSIARDSIASVGSPRSAAYSRHRRPEPRKGWREEECIGDARRRSAGPPDDGFSAEGARAPRPRRCKELGGTTLLKEVRQVAAQELRPGRLRVWRHELPHALKSKVGQAHRILAGSRDRLADEHLQRLAEPHILGARKPDRYDRHACLDREMSEALVERNELALGRPVLAFRKNRDRAADFQAAVDVLVEPPVAVAAPRHRHVAAAVAHDEPLELARHEQRRVGKKVQTRLDRKEQEEQELIGPVQMVGDDDVVG